VLKYATLIKHLQIDYPQVLKLLQ